PSILALKPSKFLFSTTLTTPATASEPQAAEAPPVTTSIRCTSTEGMVERSTPPETEDATTRWPSNKTKVRRTPNWRRLTTSMPGVDDTMKLADDELLGPDEVPKAGSWRMASAMSVWASRWSMAESTTVTGVGA